MAQAPIEVKHPLGSFGRRLESEVRARARELEVLANGEEALAREKCERAGPGVHMTAEDRQASLPAALALLRPWPGSLSCISLTADATNIHGGLCHARRGMAEPEVTRTLSS